MREVVVAGVGMIKWGELWRKSLRDLYVEASLKAIEDAGVDHVDSIYIGCMSSGLFNGQEHLASIVPDYLGMTPVPATRVESACASGSLAVRQGFIEIAAGMSDIVLVGGVEKMTDVSGDVATYALGTAADAEYESFNGITFPGLYALMALAHMAEYGTTREQLAMVAVKNHHNGSMNPFAQFPQEISVETVVNSVLVADPLRILDCSPITDGAAAVILTTPEIAKKLDRHAPVKILGSGHASDSVALHSRPSMTELRAVAKSAELAYKMAGVGPEAIHLAEVHDCFTIAELMNIEALGFAPKGQGGKVTEAGETSLTGRIPVNPSGGLKSKGHPVGATGVAQIIEVVEQLRGAAGPRQIEGAKIGLAQNMGGSGGSSLVHILEVQ